MRSKHIDSWKRALGKGCLTTDLQERLRYIDGLETGIELYNEQHRKSSFSLYSLVEWRTVREFADGTKESEPHLKATT